VEFLEALLWSEVVAGILVGLLAAGLIHWLAPSPEPVLVEAGLVALGFVGGLAVAFTGRREFEDSR
jgi:hypothetical protein